MYYEQTDINIYYKITSKNLFVKIYRKIHKYIFFISSLNLGVSSQNLPFFVREQAYFSVDPATYSLNRSSFGYYLL